MNPFSVTMFIVALLATGCKTQNLTKIKQIEYSSNSRGGNYKQIIITEELVTIKEGQRRGGKKQENIQRETKTTEWADVQGICNKVELEKVETLKSPTSDRNFDGARHSALTITPEEGKPVTHGFDNENPHNTLKPLMKLIMELNAKQK